MFNAPDLSSFRLPSSSSSSAGSAAAFSALLLVPIWVVHGFMMLFIFFGAANNLFGGGVRFVAALYLLATMLLALATFLCIAFEAALFYGFALSLPLVPERLREMEFTPAFYWRVSAAKGAVWTVVGICVSAIDLSSGAVFAGLAAIMVGFFLLVMYIPIGYAIVVRRTDGGGGGGGRLVI